MTWLDRTLLRVRYTVISGRIGVSWIAGLAASLYVANGPDAGLLNVLGAFLVMTATTMGGFIANDVCDLEKDRIAGKPRPITLGLLCLIDAVASAIFLFGFSLLAAYALFNGIAVSLVAATICALVFYSDFSKKVPFLKGAYTACLAVSPLIFGSAAGAASISASIVAMVFGFIVFRELLLDLLDIEGDRKSGLRTLAMIATPRTVKMVGWLGMAAFLSVGLISAPSLLSKLLIFGSLVSLALSYHQYAADNQKGLRLTRIPMLLGILGAATF